MTAALVQSEIPGLKLLRRGKVRDLYDLGEKVLIVATDRLSAFDCVLATPVPDKGRLLTQISAFWFESTAQLVPNHFLTTDLNAIRRELPGSSALEAEAFEGRTLLARKANRLDVECVVRGYLAGSAWQEYRKTGAVCGHKLPAGLKAASRLSEPIFTPAIKSDRGHDENISKKRLADLVGKETAERLEEFSRTLYGHAAAFLKEKGVLLADTKFEFGLCEGRLIVIDEMLTPDSSRLWPAAAYKPGGSPQSLDKQIVRDYLERTGWDKRPPAPALPPHVAEDLARRYRQYLDLVKS